MAVRIRLTRVGATKAPTYRVVVADARNPRDGRPLETIGHYNPRIDRRRQGKGVAGQGRSAVRHRGPAVPSAGHPARSEVGDDVPAKELVEFVARSLVDDPAAVSVEVVRDAEGTVLELHVAEDDMGKVIGRNGSVAKALRTLLKVTAARDGESVSLEIL